MPKSTIYFKGLDALQKGLRERATLNDVKNVVALNGTEMTAGAKRNAPVRTGDLKGSITQEIAYDGLETKVAPHMEYSAYVELGTRFMEAQPYMEPAHNVQSPKFINDLKRLMK